MSAVEDFTGTTPNHEPHPAPSAGAEFDERIRQLVADWGCDRSPELIEQIIITALKMGHDRMSVADLKLMNRSLSEMRDAAKVFAGYRDRRKVVVFGSARTAPSEPSYQLAREFGRAIVAEKFMVITGGGDGIMGAAQEGAGRENSFGLNINLPFEQQANKTIYGDPKLVNFNYFFTRKLNFVKETHAFVLFPGGFGTMDEGFEVLTLMQTGKARVIPFVLLDEPGGTYWETWMKFITDHLYKYGFVSPEDFYFFKLAHDVPEAVREIVQFYKVYQSSRWIGDQLAIRLSHWLSAAAVAELNTKFSDLVKTGAIVQRAALRQEKNEPDIWDLPRLLLTPHRRSFGRFRQLIDAINLSEVAESSPAVVAAR